MTIAMPNQQPRRRFLADLGMGFTGLALGSLLARDGVVRADSPAALPLIVPKAKSVIWYFMLGGTSHLESFDPKPALDKYAGLTIDESPFKSSVLDSPYYRKNVIDFAGTPRALMAKLYPTQIGFRRRGECGTEVSDWWPHVGDCVDDLAVIRSVWTTDNDHAAQLQFHTGRHIFDGFHPSIGSWVHYGLGSLNDNLPQFVVMGGGPGDCCGGVGAHSGSYGLARIGCYHDYWLLRLRFVGAQERRKQQKRQNTRGQKPQRIEQPPPPNANFVKRRFTEIHQCGITNTR